MTQEEIKNFIRILKELNIYKAFSNEYYRYRKTLNPQKYLSLNKFLGSLDWLDGFYCAFNWRHSERGFDFWYYKYEQYISHPNNISNRYNLYNRTIRK